MCLTSYPKHLIKIRAKSGLPNRTCTRSKKKNIKICLKKHIKPVPEAFLKLKNSPKKKRKFKHLPKK